MNDNLGCGLGIGIVIVSFGVLLAFRDGGIKVDYTNKPARIESRSYERGVSDALDVLLLMNLANKLEGKQMTLGDMTEEVRLRLKVSSPTPKTKEGK